MDANYANCIEIVNAKRIAISCKTHNVQAIHERLQWAREQAGFDTATDAARALGIREPTYLAHENGSRGFKRDTADRYAKKFKVNLEWLLMNRGSPKKGVQPQAVPIGYVGAGAEVHPIDDHAQGAGIGDPVDLPPGVPSDAVLLIVRGTSMYPRYYDGEMLFYLRTDRPPSDFIGRECVVKVANGASYVKRLRRGSQPDLFTLESFNADAIEDVAVEWAAPVRARVNR